MYPTTCVPTSQCALTSSLSSAHAGVETAARPSVQGHCAHLSLSLSLSLARSLASSRAAISPLPPPPPSRHLGPNRVSLATAAHGMHDAARLLAALGPAGCSGYHHRTSSWSSLRNWRWRLRSIRRTTRAPAKQAPRTRPAPRHAHAMHHVMHTPCTHSTLMPSTCSHHSDADLLPYH